VLSVGGGRRRLRADYEHRNLARNNQLLKQDPNVGPLRQNKLGAAALKPSSHQFFKYDPEDPTLPNK
jgi:hypothetical protein